VRELPRGADWVYEIKFDGIRAIAVKDKDRVRLYSRLHNDLTARFSEVARAVQRLHCERAVVDGEIVALDGQGRSSFQLLQSSHAATPRPPIHYYVFDLLNLEGADLKSLPLTRRKELLASLLPPKEDLIRFSPSLVGEASQLLAEACRHKLEGLIAKQPGAKYEPGRRGDAFLKIKCLSGQEFVIGGYTQPKGGRIYFGAILVGYYDKGKFIFASKVGTGFNEQSLTSLYRRFQQLKRPDCPFANLPEKRGTSGGLTAAEMTRCTWVEPRLVCQIAFTEWTRDRHLRHPVFLGLREDKTAMEVIKES
ncbi:MAG TPA: non-homologous end-joining DNA ligase, partial [Verrucomicrobiae bacterium]|nr:non-homologous end-joining DNA ligase [Verrucomicrobiae bacterium]